MYNTPSFVSSQSVGFINHFPATRSFLTVKNESVYISTCIVEKCLTLSWEKVPQHTGQGTRRRDQDVSGVKLKEAGELSKQKGKRSASWERVTVWDYVSGDDWERRQISCRKSKSPQNYNWAQMSGPFSLELMIKELESSETGRREAGSLVWI